MSEQHQEGPRKIWLRNITGNTEVTDSGDPLATEYLRADAVLPRIAELERDQLLGLTELLDEHPDGYDGPCLCRSCLEYGGAA